MARFYGAVGYVIDTEKEDSPDVVVEEPIEKFYKGDLLKNFRSLEKSEELNDDVRLSNQISITADPYALNHIFAMRYVKWMGACWKVTNVDASNYPRLMLTLGGVYNGETAK